MVGSESDENWEWFCRKLKGALCAQHADEAWDKYTIFSDRNQGLVDAINTVFDGCKHSICLRHLVENFKLQVRINVCMTSYVCGYI